MSDAAHPTDPPASDDAETSRPDADAQPPRSGGGAGAGSADALAAPGALGEALGSLLKVVFTRGRTELSRVASTSRVRLDLRQLRKDRDVMYQKLGREVRSLVDGGEIEHPGLVRGAQRIAEMDAKIEAVEQDLHAAEEQARAQRQAQDTT